LLLFFKERTTGKQSLLSFKNICWLIINNYGLSIISIYLLVYQSNLFVFYMNFI
jgi:hypothetical protein